MARSYHKGWQDKRPGWKKRVRWYQGREGKTDSIRLNFTDELGSRNEFFNSVEEATVEYEKFIAGERHALVGLDHVYDEHT